MYHIYIYKVIRQKFKSILEIYKLEYSIVA